jgi:hypothetical protein
MVVNYFWQQCVIGVHDALGHLAGLLCIKFREDILIISVIWGRDWVTDCSHLFTDLNNNSNQKCPPPQEEKEKKRPNKKAKKTAAATNNGMTNLCKCTLYWYCNSSYSVEH